MKTLFTFIAAIAFSTGIYAGNIQNLPMADEPYADDIPFNTRALALNQIIPPAEDTAADDIPFNTAAIAMMYKPCPIPAEVEAEVDDIPFSTAEVCARLKESEGEAMLTCEPDELDIFLQNLSNDIDSLIQQALGANYNSIIVEPADFLEEMGRMLIEELNFLSSYLNSLKSF